MSRSKPEPPEVSADKALDTTKYSPVSKDTTDVPMLDSELLMVDDTTSGVMMLDSELLVVDDTSRPLASGSSRGNTATLRAEDVPGRFVESPTLQGGPKTSPQAVTEKSLIHERYEIIEELEPGGMGQVFVVFDRRSERPCALKVGLDPDPRGDYHLKREFRAVKHIRHRNLVQLLELGFDRQKLLLYYTMELIRGTTFLDYVKKAGTSGDEGALKADLKRLRNGLSQLTAGIQALHAHERLHRDLKPSNVMVSYADERVVILDFGLVDYTDHNSEATLSSEGPVGTPQYMAPEQTIASRGCTPATDWYAVGVMIFEAVTGKLPISGRTLFELISKKQLNDPPRMSSLVRGVPPSLDDLVARLLSREPTERPNAAELRAWCSDQDNTATFDTETSQSTTVLLGRASAVAQICQAFNAVLSKQPRCLIAHGPSGTGKSALIRHVLRQLETTTPDILLLRGICYEHETVPYRAFDQVIEDLARYLTSQSEQERTSLLPARMSHLLDLFPVLRHIPGVERRVQADDEPVAKNHQEQRRRAFYELKHLLFNVASVHSLVLFLDDLHASDNDSARLLSELLAPPYQPPMLLIGACRSQSSTQVPFLEDFFTLVKTAELQNIEFIEIGPLPHTQAVRVAAQLLSDRGRDRPRYAELLASSCAGNSSLMDQIVGLIKIPSGPSSGQVELDEELFSLENIISRRLQGLHAEARRVLVALAVGGTPITAEVIAQVAKTTANIHALLQQLLDQNFVYTHERDGTVLASCFNQALRDAILVQVADETRQELHLALATAFMEDLPASAKVCAHHLIASGNQEQAVEHLETAALAARGALAFEQAAELYRVAMRCAPNNHSLELKLAQALELAGHSAEASHYLLAVASRSSGRQQIELTGRATLQMLISGELEHGLDTLAKLLPMIDMDLPRSRESATKAFTRAATLLKIHPLTFYENTHFQISSQLLVRIDTTWNAGRGLMLVDPIQAGYLMIHSALLALAAGDPRRIARALALCGMLLANRDSETGRRILNRAEEIAHQIGDQYAIGLCAISMGLTRRSEGLWTEGLTGLNFGADHLRTHAVGVTWEQSLALTGTFSALEALGDFPTLEARIPALLRQADTTGDVHTSLLATLYSGLLLLARDQVREADLRISEALARWSRLDRYLAHMHALKLSVYIDLYRNRPERAWERMTKLPEDVMADHAQHLSFRVGRNDWYVLQGRTALARANETSDPDVTAPLLRTCTSIARLLSRQENVYALGSSAVLRAGIANLLGATDEAIDRLGQAEKHFRQAKMALHVACVRRRLGVLIGGERGKKMVSEADTNLIRAGVQNPEKWILIFTPGLAPRQT